MVVVIRRNSGRVFTFFTCISCQICCLIIRVSSAKCSLKIFRHELYGGQNHVGIPKQKWVKFISLTDTGVFNSATLKPYTSQEWNPSMVTQSWNFLQILANLRWVVLAILFSLVLLSRDKCSKILIPAGLKWSKCRAESTTKRMKKHQ